MKHSKDPFEAAIKEEQEESPPESPVGSGDGSDEGRIEIDKNPEEEEERAVSVRHPTKKPKTSVNVVVEANNKDEDEKEEEENMEVVLTKYPIGVDLAKMAKMQTILSQFTEEQMSRYESFRRYALQKGILRKVLMSNTESQKISAPVIIVTCGIGKMFVGELVETTRVVMGERKESGPIRPYHIRESYRRLKHEGKVPKRSVPRLSR